MSARPALKTCRWLGTFLLAATVGCAAEEAQAPTGGDLRPPAADDGNGNGNGNDNGDDNAGSATPAPEPPAAPTAAKFAAGDPFDYAKVAKPSQMVATMLATFDYANATAPKAIAINDQGLGYVAVRTGATQAEVDLIAKQACFVIGGAKPCVLLARGGVFAVDTAGAAAPDYVLAKPTALADLPFLTAAAKAKAAADYAAAASPKAIAIGLDGTIGKGFPASGGLNASTIQDAQRVALERCEMKSLFAPCTLFASGTTVSFDPAAPMLAPRIDYGRTSLQANLPGSVAGAWSLLQDDYVPKLGSSKGAVYISRTGAGAFFTSTSATTADAEAKARCQARAGTEPCLKYATNLSVVFKATDIEATAPANLALHCKAVPRASCDAHRAIGCTTSGEYYIGGASGVALAKCTF